MHVVPGVRKPFRGLVLFSNIPTGKSASVDGSGRHSSDDVISEILGVTVVKEAPEDSGFPGSVGSTTRHNKSCALSGRDGGSESGEGKSCE